MAPLLFIKKIYKEASHQFLWLWGCAPFLKQSVRLAEQVSVNFSILWGHFSNHLGFYRSYKVLDHRNGFLMLKYVGIDILLVILSHMVTKICPLPIFRHLAAILDVILDLEVLRNFFSLAPSLIWKRTYQSIFVPSFMLLSRSAQFMLKSTEIC